MDTQKIAIVTGGSSGLGLSIAQKLAANNIFVLIIGRDKKKLADACEAIGSNSVGISFDISQLEKIPTLINDVKAKYKHIDILVNNAGINLKKPMLEVTDADFQNIVTTNLTSVFSISREVAKVMVAQQQGAIINISSMAAYYGIPKVTAYTASKAGIEGLTRAMAVELSPKGIRVNCIAPGFIATNMSSTALDSDPERKHRVLTRTPMGKLGTPTDVANAVYFLTHDDAGFITGISLRVDGGNAIGF